jgi:hypothetical protein
MSQAPVAHVYNHSYSRGKDQEDHSSKPAWANSLWDPISKNPSQNRVSGVTWSVSPEFKPQYYKKEKKKKRHTNNQSMWKIAQSLWSSGKCKWKPQWAIIPFQLEWLSSKRQKTTNACEDAEKELGGNVNQHSHYGKQ